mgnify:CR=1 FL=1
MDLTETLLLYLFCITYLRINLEDKKWKHEDGKIEYILLFSILDYNITLFWFWCHR